MDAIIHREPQNSYRQAKGKQKEETDEDIEFKKKQQADKAAVAAAAKVLGLQC